VAETFEAGSSEPGPDAGSDGAVQRGANLRDAAGFVPTGIVIEKAAVFEGSMTTLDRPASPEAIACPFASRAVTVIRMLVAAVAPGLRSVPRTTRASPDFSCV